MNNETVLDWLARNVHEWPEGKREVLVCYPRNVDTLIWSCVLSNTGWITKEQWLSRRAELQNKPSWKRAPDWAEWLAQHSTGCWCWGNGNAKEASNGIWYSPALGKTQWTGMAGEILGDWRDTLERRPEPFKQFTSIEDNQEQGLQKDNGWFERGELPPAGVECEFHGGMRNGCFWPDELKDGAQVSILCHYNPTGSSLVAVFSFGINGGRLVSQAIASCFRPIHTEREKAMEEMLKDSGALECQAVMSIIESLLDNGWSKEQK